MGYRTFSGATVGEKRMVGVVSWEIWELKFRCGPRSALTSGFYDGKGGLVTVLFIHNGLTV